jgi:hypothetical protein
MSALFWMWIGSMIGLPVGFVLCAVLTAGQRADDADRIARLREENEHLRVGSSLRRYLQ